MATWSATSVVYDGYIYEIGGDTTNGIASTVEYAPINSNGSLGNWTTTTSLPAVTDNATALVSNGYVYQIGGCAGTTCAATSTVDYAQINPAGYTSSYTTTTSLPAANMQANGVTYDGYAYQIGGLSTATTTNYAPINSNGTLGAWSSTMLRVTRCC